MSRFAQNTLIVILCTAIGMVIRLAVTSLLASRVGVNEAMDVYVAVNGIPDFLINIGTGVVSFVFLPQLTRFQLEENKSQTFEIQEMFICIVLGGCALTATGLSVPNIVVDFAFSGFDLEKKRMSISIFSILLPVALCMTLSELVSCFYYVKHQFLVPSLCKLFVPIFNVFALLMFRDHEATISVISLATLSGAALQFLILGGHALLNGYIRFEIGFHFFGRGTKRFLYLAAPLVGGMIFYKSLPLIERWFGSHLIGGSLAAVGYAQRIQGIFHQLLLSGISSTFFPLMAQYAAEKKWDFLNREMLKVLSLLLFFSIPISIYFGLCGRPIIEILFQRGEFTEAASELTNSVFLVYMLVFPLMSIGGVISQGYYITHDTLTPVLTGLVETAVFLLAISISIESLGVYALPFATCVLWVATIILNGTLVTKKLNLTFLPQLGRVILKQIISVSPGLFLILLVSRLTIYSRTISIATILASFLSYGYIQLVVFKTNESMLLLKHFKKIFRTRTLSKF